MRKRHLIDQNNDKRQKNLKNVNGDVNVGTKVKMPNHLHVELPDVDLFDDDHLC